MMIVSLIGWWYGQGWLWAVKRLGFRLQHIMEVFAVKTLIRTWFAPWKQIYTPKNFQNFLQVSADNAISRVVGGIVRTAVLLVALVWATLAVVYGIIIMVLWPMIPLSIVILPALALLGVTV